MENNFFESLGSVKEPEIQVVNCDLSGERLNGSKAFTNDNEDYFINYDEGSNILEYVEDVQAYVRSEDNKETFLDDELVDITLYKLVFIEKNGDIRDLENEEL